MRHFKPPYPAAALWAAQLFAAGFLLGTMRTLVTAPALGELAATALELPVMWALGWWLCGRAIARFRVAPADRWRMGLVFLALLLAAEQLLGLTLMGRTPAGQWAAYAALPAQIGLAAQVITATFPHLQHRLHRRR